jgi:hypothetical protein
VLQVGSTADLRERLYAKDLALRTLLATQSPRASPAASPAASPQRPPRPPPTSPLRSRSPLGSPAKALLGDAKSSLGDAGAHTPPPYTTTAPAVAAVDSPPSSPRLDAVRRRRPHSKHMQVRLVTLRARIQTQDIAG